MRIAFRVDASPQIGIGHLMRCLTLAEVLKKEGHEIHFISARLAVDSSWLHQYKVSILPKENNQEIHYSDLAQEIDAKKTIDTLCGDIDYLIVDNYDLDIVWHRILRRYTNKIMVIDDLADKEFDCDLLLNQNLGSCASDYQGRVPDSCKLLLGCDYALLREEFLCLRKRALEKRESTQQIKNILVCMGGSDKSNATYKVLQQINNDYNTVVVLGEASIHKQMIKKFSSGRNISVVINANNMSELILNADLAIGAGGSTSWERCCLGLPTLVYVLSENQRSVAENLEKIGAVIISRNLSREISSMASDLSMWRSMSMNSQKVCDGTGVKEVKKYLEM